MEIEARLEKVFFTNPENGWMAGRFQNLETRQVFTAAGILFEPEEDQEYRLEGEETFHKKYGKQIAIQSASRILPTSETSVIQFLSSSSFKGIGKKTAQQIYETLGEDCLEQIAANPAVLYKVKDLGEKKAEIIQAGMRKYGGNRDVFLRLASLGLSERQIGLLTSHYTDVLETLQEDPYHPYYHVYGFGYKSACKLADGFKMDPEDPRRTMARIEEAARTLCMQSGDTYVMFYDLYEKVMGLPQEDFEMALAGLQGQNALTIRGQTAYPYGLYEEEQEIARILKKHCFPLEEVDRETVDEEIGRTEFALNIQYDEMQKEAIRSFFTESFFILNGGPGTGKSTTVHGILHTAKKIFPSALIQLTAPTGRAAKRLSQLSGQEARTIHSLLKWNPDSNTFEMNEKQPLECDFLVVDEFSMVDTHLFASLLQALPARCRILLIGDEDQLESVGPGKVFSDIIDSGICPVVRLDRIFRQKNGSGIVSLAAQIREEQPFTYQDGVTFEQKEGEEILEELMLRYPSQADLYDVQVLAPKYKGLAGIDAANEKIQQLVNPPAPDKKQLKVGNTILRKGDKVMLLKNMPEQEVFNGDIGRISYISVKEQSVEVEFNDTYVTFEKEGLLSLNLAYCVSVHKAQGSEFQSVFCLIDPGARWMMNRRLLYTAVSRAKKELVLIGDRMLFETRAALRQQRTRRTTLLEAITEQMETGKHPDPSGQKF